MCFIVEFQVYFKCTPERFMRYIKLLFEGGRIVLCGILERVLGDQDLSVLLVQNQETLKINIENTYLSCIFSGETSYLDHRTWDIYLSASVILLVFNEHITRVEFRNIELIKSARMNYADSALSSLDTDTFLTVWTDLINCLNHLSINIPEENRNQVEQLIEVYKKKDEEGCNVEEYFEQLKVSGIKVKTLNDIYNGRYLFIHLFTFFIYFCCC